MFGILDFFNIPGVNPASDKEVSAILFNITRGIADTSVEEEIKKKSNFSDDNIFHNTAEYLNLIKRTYMTYVAMRISALWYERSVYDCELHGILYRKHTEEQEM